MARESPVEIPNLHELLIQEVVDYAIYMLSPTGEVISWNTGAERIKGYSEAEILGAHFSLFYTDEDRIAGIPARALKTATESGRLAAEGWRLRRDGSRFWAVVVLAAIYKDGEVVGFAKITRDMTEQHAAQVAALESERRFRLLIESVTDYAICMLDPAGYVTNWNAGAERITLYRSADIVGCHFSDFYTDEDRQLGLPALALLAARTDGRYATEGWRVRRDGSRFWANVLLDPIQDSGVLVGFAKITRDLTERREAQLQLEASRQQLFQAQKMEAVGQLTGGLAHDFNNVLTGIIGSLTLIESRIAAGRYDGLSRYIAAAQGAAGRAAGLTHRLLAFARRQTLDAKVTAINDLILNMGELVQQTVGSRVTLSTDLTPNLWAVRCDSNQLESAILNLCLNARDAMPSGGSIVIRTINQRIADRAARDLRLADGDYIAVSVTDTGTGMAPEVIARAFDPFFTTKPIGQGTGLGLSMIHGFAEQSGGRARIASEPGQGATVTLYLPRHSGEAPDETLPEPEFEASYESRRGSTILVVDDEEAIRMLVVEVLSDFGYVCLESWDSDHAIETLRAHPEVRLMITDVGLPGDMNGRQVAEAARTFLPDLKVLFVTGYADSAVIGETFGDGTRILGKPFSLDVLINQVNDLCA
ncbi:hybrid sensor histidine kinase/response regulator [Acidisoma silvae]|uniref:histidine kinase n=1 Tax=Acidisoma silvae TaxID=2802396 RepID=A0A963YRP5_9PROT|nr:PAS domain-containing sensor histidine kinase [Acidisoma silvae]MCB8875135.1 PAS domain S-box protein [Acidisoma silvae]